MPQNLYILLFFFFFTFSFLIKSDGADDPFPKTCPANATCNGVPIRYPFWLQTDYTTTTTPSQKYCGYPDFGIKCEGGVPPILKLSNDEFYVNNIDNNCNLTLVDIDVFNNKKCPRVRHNTTELESLHLAPTLVDSNLTFYFNCSTQLLPSPPTIQLDCLSSESIKSYVVEGGSSIDDQTLSEWYKYCEDKVEVAVNTVGGSSHFNNLGSEFGRVLNQGLVLGWQRLESCRGCENSRGRCGYDNVENLSLCFCSDGNVTYNKPPYCKGKKSANTGLKIGIGIGASLGSLVIVLVFFLIYRWRKKTKYGGGSVVSRIISSFPSSISDSERGGTHMGVPIFTYSELEKATNNFDSNKELGDGGFGTVYKGKLQDGRVVAVKRLYESNFKRVEQFMNEIEILTRLRHPNLVTLYGSTSPQCRQLLLVYEYIPNGTISDHLYGENAKPGSLAWKTRMSIAIDTASALAYLHALKVIHRDVKTNNILLDDNFRVKVADFGLSRLFPTNATHVSTAPQGTPGYVDPEYHQCYQLTDKSDVYSFGVVLIELISCKPAVDITRHRHEINLSNMAINKIQNGELNELVDPSLGFESDYEVRDMITEVAELAFQCLQNDREFRPCMEDVLKVLKRISSKYYDQKNQSEVDVLADDALLLKKFNPTPSPDSVTSKWPSKSTTSSSSS